MKKVIKTLLAIPVLFVWRGISLFRPSPKATLRILMFHDIPQHDMKKFDRLMDYVKNKYTILSPRDAEDWLSKPKNTPTPKSNGPSFLITFDDGFVSNEEVARKILAKHNISAIFFVCPGLIELGGASQSEAVSNNIFELRSELIANNPQLKLMSWKNLEALAAAGHSICAHGMNHYRLNNIKGSALKDEIVESGNFLEKKLAQKVNWFAYAFGDIESISSEALSIIDSRFNICRTGIRGANSKSSRWLFADQMGLDHPFAYQQLILEGGLDLLYKSQRKKFKSLVERAG